MIYDNRFVSAVLTTLFLICGALMIAVGIASAKPLIGNARFEHTIDVRSSTAAGIGCRVFGFCDSVTPGAIRTGAVVHHGERNEPVVVNCTIGRGSLYEVTLDRDGDSTYTGLVPVGAVQVDQNTRVEPC